MDFCNRRQKYPTKCRPSESCILCLLLFRQVLEPAEQEQQLPVQEQLRQCLRPLLEQVQAQLQLLRSECPVEYRNPLFENYFPIKFQSTLFLCGLSRLYFEGTTKRISKVAITQIIAHTTQIITGTRVFFSVSSSSS